jgi:hypothetical protein
MDKVIFSTSSPATIIIQEDSLKEDCPPVKLIFRLGWISFILGTCTLLIHYISIDHLGNYSPVNAGIISGSFFIFAGLLSVIAGYRENSVRCLKHAQIWSFIVNIIFAPGLIVVSITALIIDSKDIHPICKPTLSSSRAILFGNSLEVYPSHVPCMEVINLLNITQILNTIQLIIGVICFFVHIILLSIQRKVIQQMKTNEKKIIHPQAFTLDISKMIYT